MNVRRRVLVLLAAVSLSAVLAYLREPPWLEHTTSGLHGWTVDEDGTRVRWAAGRSSFFVPADARLVRIPVRATFDDPADWRIVVSVALDGRPIDRLALEDSGWRMVEIRMPRRGSRRLRRIDIHADRTRSEGRSILLSEVELRH